MKGFYYSAAAVRLLLEHVEQGIPDREPIDVMNVGELNVLGRGVCKFMFESTVELDNIVGHWERKLYWGFHPESGVIAAWDRGGSARPRTYVFRLLSKDTSFEACVEIARELRKHRAPDMGMSTQEHFDALYQTASKQLEEGQRVVDELTVLVNEYGATPTHVECLASFSRRVESAVDWLRSKVH